MPNWCSNTLTLSHTDPKEIDRAVDAFKKGEFLATLVPRPVAEEDNWYEWNVQNWGTKWDVGGTDSCDPVVDESGTTAQFGFDSAWAPPVAAYDYLVESGFEITAMYYEPGCAFAGIYNENGDDCYDLTNMDSRQVAEDLPDELNECFGIAETMAEYEDEEPLTEWYLDGVEEKGLKHE